MDTQPITLRGHHVRHLQKYLHERRLPDLDDSYGNINTHLEKIFQRITEKRPDVRVSLVDTLDSICTACPKKNKRCEDTSIARYDQSELNYFGLYKAVYRAKSLVERLQKNSSC